MYAVQVAGARSPEAGRVERLCSLILLVVGMPRKSLALRGLVAAYLQDECPKAARLLEAQGTLDDFAAGVELDAWRKATADVFGKGVTLATVLRARAGKKSVKSTPKPSPKLAAKKAPKADLKPMPAADSDDDVPPRKPASKRPTPKPTPRAAPKRPIVADSDSDSDAPPVRRKAASKRSTPKPSPRLAPTAAKALSDDDAPRKGASKKTSPKLGARKAPIDTDSDDDVPRPPKRQSPRTSAAAPRRDPKAANDPAKRFCRINVEKVQFIDDRLRDNTAGVDASAFLQNQKMMAVRGKEFNKHKQKNKAKLYAAGVNQAVQSYKFNDDE